MTSPGPRAAAGFFALLMAGTAAAQTSTTPAGPPAGLESFSLPPQGTPTPAPVPDAPRLNLPAAQPTPRTAPTPRATPTPRAAPSPAASPTPRRAPAQPQATPAPTPAAPPPTPVATPVPSAPPFVPVATPAPIPTAAPAIAAPGTVAPEARATREGGGAMWPWLLGTAVVALGAGVWLGRRGAKPAALPAPVAEPVRPAPVPPKAPGPPAAPVAPAPPPAPPAPPPVPLAPIAIAVRPQRVGLNMLSATAEAEVTLTNTGAVPIERVVVDARLMSAHQGLDAELAAMPPLARPAVPPFALAAGESRTVRTVTAIARDGIHVITAADRPMFVPVLAIAARTGGGIARQAFALGVERTDSAKLSPIWLDAQSRMFDQVGVRPHRWGQ